MIAAAFSRSLTHKTIVHEFQYVIRLYELSKPPHVSLSHGLYPQKNAWHSYLAVRQNLPTF